MEFVVKSTSIANSMSTFISPPQGCYCSSTVLTGNDNRGISLLGLKSIDIDRDRFVLGFHTAMAATLPLHDIKLGALRHAVIVCWTPVTALSAAGTVAAATTGTGA